MPEPSPERQDRLDRLVSATITAALDDDIDTAMAMWPEIAFADIPAVIGLLLSHVRDITRCWVYSTCEDSPTNEQVLAVWRDYLARRKATEP